MKKLVKSVVPLIESVFSDLTQSEKVIATFFIDNKEKDIDFIQIIFSKEFKIWSSWLFGIKSLAPKMNIFRSFKKKNVINSTEANPIPKLLIVPKREFKKSGIKLKFIL